MGTRADIRLIDNEGNELWFYRHSDGAPETTKPSLQRFVDKINKGEIRNNLGQAAGWLIVLGRMESGYGYVHDWKVGAYEPSVGPHGDTSYTYTINVEEGTLEYSG